MFARKVVAERGWVSESDVQALRDAGYGDGEVVEIVTHIGVNLFTNYFNHIAGPKSTSRWCGQPPKRGRPDRSQTETAERPSAGFPIAVSQEGNIEMQIIVKLATWFLAVLIVAAGTAYGQMADHSFADGVVSPDGSIRVPQAFRTDYVMLGAWSVAGDVDTGGAVGLHVVYAPRDAVEAYRETGAFPDGTVLVKELFNGNTEFLTTGEATSAASTAGYFVMVKDSEGRFPGNPLGAMVGVGRSRRRRHGQHHIHRLSGRMPGLPRARPVKRPRLRPCLSGAEAVGPSSTMDVAGLPPARGIPIACLDLVSLVSGAIRHPDLRGNA